MLASKNLIPAVRTPKDGEHWIDLLAGELCVRLRESREIEPGLWPKTIVLTHRSGRGYENAGKSRQAPFPYTKALTGEYIAKMGRRMWVDVVAGLTNTGKQLDVCNVSLARRGRFSIEADLSARTTVHGRGPYGGGSDQHRGLLRIEAFALESDRA
jgi:DNA polymerase eta